MWGRKLSVVRILRNNLKSIHHKEHEAHEEKPISLFRFVPSWLIFF
jgi:hypothetical protein